MKREKFELKAAKEFSLHGKEKMTSNVVGNTVYGFGSELATLRCYKEYAGAKDVRHGFSKNLNTWYFAYEVQYVSFED